jgi:hypothetical protein
MVDSANKIDQTPWIKGWLAKLRGDYHQNADYIDTFGALVSICIQFTKKTLSIYHLFHTIVDNRTRI